MASSSHSNSPPMKTGAKCFDIYRLPLLPGRFADASEPGRRPEGRKGRGGRGDLRWRRRSGLYFLEKGQRQRARDLKRTRVNRSISPPPISRRRSSTSWLNRQKYWSQRPVRKQLSPRGRRARSCSSKDHRLDRGQRKIRIYSAPRTLSSRKIT